MSRRFKSLAPVAAFLAFAAVGCTPPAETKTGTTGTTGSAAESTTTTGSTPSTETTGGTTSTTGTPEQKPADAPLPDKPKDGDDVAILETSAGKVVVMFYPTKAPNHVKNFLMLAGKGFYNGTRFHRCISGFMIQGGDPKSKDLKMASEWGTGGNMDKNGKEINVLAEFNDVKHVRGVLSMARSASPDSASSQFFIMVADNPGLDGQYTAFGKVVSGLDIVDKIVATGPADPNLNGSVEPSKAVVLKSAKVAKWPVK